MLKKDLGLFLLVVVVGVVVAYLNPLFLSQRNLANTANFDNPTGDRRSTDFLRLTALRGGNGQPRAAQFSVRMGF